MRERIIREQADRACQSFSSFAVPVLRPTQKSQISVSILVFRLQGYRFLVLCRSFLVSAELGENNSPEIAHICITRIALFCSGEGVKRFVQAVLFQSVQTFEN